jgi:hypothetical protein
VPGGGLAAHRAQKTPVNLLAGNVEIDLLVLPGRVDTLDLTSVLGSGALWSTPSEPPGHRLSATGSAFDRVREAGRVRKHDLVAAGHLHQPEQPEPVGHTGMPTPFRQLG